MSAPGLKYVIRGLKLVTIGCSVYLARRHLYDIVSIEGSSMSPTFNPMGDIVLLDRTTGYRNYKVGDIVVSCSPLDPHKKICKRIVALPGQHVTMQTRHHPLAPITYSHVLIPYGHVWLSGDNPSTSEDSTTFGPVPMGLFEGRVMARVYPFSEIKKVGDFFPPSLKNLSIFNWIFKERSTGY